MKICMYCESMNDDSAKVCTGCGANAFKNKCNNCGTVFRSAFCPTCGIKAGTQAKVCPQCGEKYFTPACPKCGHNKLDDIDEDALSAADLLYYNEVMLRCTNKLLQVSND